MMCQRGGDPPRAQDERGRALIPEKGVGRPLQTQVQRPVLTGNGMGQAGKAGAPQQRLGQGLRPGLCSWSSNSCDSACGLHVTSLLGTQSPITEQPCLEQRCLGMVGLSWGGGAQLGGPGRDGGRDLGPESCVCCSEDGAARRKEVCPQTTKAVRKQGPSSGDLLPGPLGPTRGGSGPE